jgi:hypothetical protein
MAIREGQITALPVAVREKVHPLITNVIRRVDHADAASHVDALFMVIDEDEGLDRGRILDLREFDLIGRIIRWIVGLRPPGERVRGSESSFNQQLME